jgi:hypothetical protein
MANLLTPRRRKLTKAAQRDIDAIVEAWQRRTGSTSGNTAIGLSIRAGAIRRRIEAHVLANNAMPGGSLTVSLVGTPYHITDFTVDLDELRQ